MGFRVALATLALAGVMLVGVLMAGSQAMSGADMPAIGPPVAREPFITLPPVSLDEEAGPADGQRNDTAVMGLRVTPRQVRSVVEARAGRSSYLRQAAGRAE